MLQVGVGDRAETRAPTASILGAFFAHVMRHVDEHVADVLVGQFVEDLFCLPVAAHEPGAAQEPQMMADQRLR